MAALTSWSSIPRAIGASRVKSWTDNGDDVSVSQDEYSRRVISSSTPRAIGASRVNSWTDNGNE